MTRRISSNQIRLQGHEKFALREGWLAKGIAQVVEDPSGFVGDAGPDNLGIGANMVKSLRYWLRATGLTEDRSAQLVLSEFGRLVLEYDPYFEDIFTLWRLHAKLVKNIHLATSWYMYFNRCDAAQLERGQILSILKREIDQYAQGSCSEASVRSDVDVLLAMYGRTKAFTDPEDKSVSPFARLGLIRQSEKRYSKSAPDRRNVDARLILCEVIEQLSTIRDTGTPSVSIDRLTGGDNSVASIYQLGTVAIHEYLDELDNDGWIRVDRTAGLDVVYPQRQITVEEAERNYYRSR